LNSQQMAKQSNICGAILAGGRGQRVGGVDKGLLKFDGRPLIEHAIAAIVSQVSTIMISANRNQEQYERLGYPVIADGEADFPGPLAGISGVLEKNTLPYVLIVPCDMPFLPLHLVERLSVAMNYQRAMAAVACDAERLQPLCLLLHRDIREDLLCYRRSGGRKVRDWLKGLRYCEVDFSDCSEAFANINTQEQLNFHEMGAVKKKGYLRSFSNIPQRLPWP